LVVKADQVGALCIRRRNNGSCQVLLITSRGTGRWVIPKGWRAKGLKDHEAAAREAKEEAGVSGAVRSKPIGNYS
jgi:8-oxo-dGTP pyrophosphatase MutT (NUDIX family)